MVAQDYLPILLKNLFIDSHRSTVALSFEPFGSLDALTRERMGEELLRIWQTSRKTVVLVTHSVPEAVFLADRVLVLGTRPALFISEIEVDLPLLRLHHGGQFCRSGC